MLDVSYFMVLHKSKHSVDFLALSFCLCTFQKPEETCVYLKESLMPNTVLTLMYNIGKSGEDRKRHMKYNTNHVVLYNQLRQTASACVCPVINRK